MSNNFSALLLLINTVTCHVIEIFIFLSQFQDHPCRPKTIPKRLLNGPFYDTHKLPVKQDQRKCVSELFLRASRTILNFFECRYGTKRRKSSSSYQNSISYVHAAHPDNLKLSSADQVLTQAHLEKYFTTKNSNHLFGWMDFVIYGLLSFSYIEKDVMKRNVKHESMTLDKFRKYYSI